LAYWLNDVDNIQRKGRKANRVDDKNPENYFYDIIRRNKTKIDKKLH